MSQFEASNVRYVTFSPDTGASYTAFLHANTGDVIQQFDNTDTNNIKFFPSLSVSNPIWVRFMATSSKSQGEVVPDSIKYYVNGTELTFDSSGNCTNAAGYFKKIGTQLGIVGNIAQYLNFNTGILSAVATKDGVEMFASTDISISPYQGDGNMLPVSIYDSSSSPFTFLSPTESHTLSAQVWKNASFLGNIASLAFTWKVSDSGASGGWRIVKDKVLGSAGGNSINVAASSVHTYATVLVEVYRVHGSGSNVTYSLLGADTVGVMDASDPLDMVFSIKVFSGSGNEVSIDGEPVIQEHFPSSAYVRFLPKVVVRGTNTAPQGTITWQDALLKAPSGLTLRNIQYAIVGGQVAYTVGRNDISSAYGKHSIIFTAKIS